MQRCVLPDGANEMQFSYRFNDTAIETPAAGTKRRVAPAEDDQAVRADCSTYRMRLPLRISEEILNMYPFSIQFASCKVELTSTAAAATAGADVAVVTHLPDLKLDGGHRFPLQSLVTTNNPTKLCRHHVFALASPVPVVYGKTEYKEGSNAYTPIVNIGFYVIEPAVGTLVYMLVPVILILLVLTRTIVQDRDEFTATLVTLTVALVLTLPMVRRGALSQTGLGPSDWFVLILFTGIFLCVMGIGEDDVHYTWRVAGVWTSWASFMVPLVGFVRYNYLLWRIRTASADLNFAREAEVGKQRGEAFRCGALSGLPSQKEVLNSPLQIFAEAPVSLRSGQFAEDSRSGLMMSSDGFKSSFKMGAVVSTAASATMH